jgi:uncharacterized membrane protein YphA (DoxX/SURF4 family)
MSKRNKIIYWISTIWLSLGMISTGGAQLFKVKTGAGSIQWITELGYPVYLLIFLGICKILGTMVILLPRFPVIKEWAYAGFFFLMAGAIYSHLVVGDDATRLIPGFLNIFLIGLSWYFRPADRKIVVVRE